MKAPPEKVFGILSNFESAPQHSNYWKSVKLTGRAGNSATYDTVAEAEGRKLKSVTKITPEPNEKITAETVDGDGKGTLLTFTFSRIPEGTQVTLAGEIVLPGFAKMLGGLVKGRIESGMRDELAIVKKLAEGQ
jgi:uncharacterized membrane protein